MYIYVREIPAPVRMDWTELDRTKQGTLRRRREDQPVAGSSVRAEPWPLGKLRVPRAHLWANRLLDWQRG